ncbi:MAG: NUDIX hydrolase, partial [Gemmatimonadota bacterium]
MSTRRIYSGRVIDLDVDRVRFPDGSTGELEVIRHSGAAAVVALTEPPDAANPRVVLLRQYRYAAGGAILEIPAGRLEPGESAEACARRELLEEAGYVAGSWRTLTTIYTTPGFTDERIHLFLAHDLEAREPAGEADEFIEVRVVPWSEAMQAIRDGR